SGLRKKIVIVASEKMSSIVNFQDRTTCTLFGDGAAAALIEPTEEENTGVRDGVFHTDGRGLEHLVMLGGGSVLPATEETVREGKHFLFQDGRNVYKNAVTDMLTASQDVMARNNLTVDDIDWFIPHQANLRIIEAVGSRLGIDPAKVLVNIEEYGNTSAASIPICIDQYKDRLKKGDKIILTAFGAGFTWGAMYVVWDI
ncbi:MAG: 3-oxoacyl-ACP synthase, partial [Duncaniella sp.]|nr:3-oxoacyl-ACP synthase [Duncaniella sp.]